MEEHVGGKTGTSQVLFFHFGFALTMPGFEDFVIQWMNQGGERGSTVPYSKMVTVWNRMLVGKMSEVEDADQV